MAEVAGGNKQNNSINPPSFFEEMNASADELGIPVDSI
jgi:hypothetical protein